MSYCSCSGNAVDILDVSRFIKSTIYREKTEIINLLEVRRPPAPLDDAPAQNHANMTMMVMMMMIYTGVIELGL